MKKLNYIALGVAMISLLNTTPLYALDITQNSDSTSIYLGYDLQSETDGQAIVSIPSSITLTKDTENNTFTNTSFVYAYGDMCSENVKLAISVPTTTIFTDEENTNSYTGNITFGTNGFYAWDYETLKQVIDSDGNVVDSSLDKQNFIITVENASEIEEGTYSSTITFNLEVIENTDYQNFIKTKQGIIIDGKLWSYTPAQRLMKDGSGNLYMDLVAQTSGIDTMVINNNSKNDENFDSIKNYCSTTGKITLAKQGNQYTNGLKDITNNGIQTIVADCGTTCFVLGYTYTLENLYLPNDVRVLYFGGSSSSLISENCNIYYYGSAVELFMSICYGTNTIRKGDTTTIYKYYSTINPSTSSVNSLGVFKNFNTFKTCNFYYYDDVNNCWKQLPTSAFVDAYNTKGNAKLSSFESLFPADDNGEYEPAYEAYLAPYIE